MYQRMSGVVDADFVPVAEPAPPPEASAEAGGAGLGAVLQKLTGKLRRTELSTDDLLLAAILWLVLRDSGDDDLVWILAALFFTGAF